MKQYKASEVKAFIEGKLNKINQTSRTLEDLYNFIMKEYENEIAYSYFDDEGKEIKVKYGTLRDKIYNTASRLAIAFQGIPHGGVIGLKIKNSPNWLIFFWAILMSGKTPLLIDAKLPIENTNNLLKQSKACGLIANEEGEFCVPKFRVNEVNNLNKDYEFATDFANHIIFCSSGTTGDAKLMVYRGQNLVHQINEAAIFPGKTSTVMNPGKMRNFAMLPLHHIFGFVAVFLWYSFFGKQLVFPSSMATSDLLYAIKKARVTQLYSVPLFWDSIAQNVKRQMSQQNAKLQDRFEKMIAYNNHKITKKEADGGASKAFNKIIKKKLLGVDIQYAISGGGFLSPKTLALINGLGYPLYNGFGMTELGVTSVETSPNVEQRLKGSIGKPLYGIEYRIGNGNLADDESGELFVKTPAMHSREIIGGKTIRLEKEGEWYPTGDIAIKDLNGDYYIKGRIKDTVILANGENVYPDEIEYYFKDIPNLHNVVCLGAKLPGESEEKIILVCEVDNTIQKSGIEQIYKNVDSINATLSNEKRVQKVLIDTHPLPVSGSMKVKRFKIKQSIENGSSDYIGLDDNKKKKEISFEGFDKKDVKDTIDRITTIFSKVLLLPEFKIAPDAIWTVDLGGDSMSYVEMVQMVNEEFGVEIEMEKYGQLTNVYDFAKEVLTILSKKNKK